VFNSKPLIEVIICNYALFPDKPWDWCSSQTGPIHPPFFWEHLQNPS
jgi:hypothetical protein